VRKLFIFGDYYIVIPTKQTNLINNKLFHIIYSPKVNNTTPFKPLLLDRGFLLSFATDFQSRVVRACPDRLKDDSLTRI